MNNQNNKMLKGWGQNVVEAQGVILIKALRT